MKLIEGSPSPALLGEYIMPKRIIGGDKVTLTTKFNIDRGHPFSWRFIGVPVMRIDADTFTLDFSQAERVEPSPFN